MFFLGNCETLCVGGFYRQVYMGGNITRAFTPEQRNELSKNITLLKNDDDLCYSLMKSTFYKDELKGNTRICDAQRNGPCPQIPCKKK